MTRRELLALAKNSLISLSLGGLLGGCELLGKQITSISNLSHELASLLGYLLYEDKPPIERVREIETYLNTIAQNSLRKRLVLELLYYRIGMKTISFDTLSSENKRDYLEKTMPILCNSSVIIEILEQYLQGDRILQYLDYPDLPGEFGECGWLVLEGEVWDRYYPSSGS